MLNNEDSGPRKHAEGFAEGFRGRVSRKVFYIIRISVE